MPLSNYISNTDRQFIAEWNRGIAEFTVFTSGSTSAPKAITWLRKNMEISAEATVKAMQLKNEHVLICIPTEFTGGKMLLARALHLGWKYQIMQPKANPFLAIESNHPYTFVSLTPLQLHHILQHQDSLAKLNRFKTVLIGGGGIYREDESQLPGLSPTFYASYGMTETYSHFALRNLSKGAEAFTVLPPFDINAEEGVLQVQSTPMGLDLVTNDWVELKGERQFVFLGRADNVINSGGYKVFPEAVEKQLAQIFPQLVLETNFRVCGQADTVLGQKVILQILEGTTPPDLTKLENQLPKAQIPKSIEKVAQFKRTETGKIVR